MSEQKEEQQEQKEFEPQRASRLKDIEAIADEVSAKHEAEVQQNNADYFGQEPEPKADPTDPTPAPLAQRTEPEPAPRKFRGVVDGQEQEFDEQAVIEAGLRYLQKDRTADKRLQEASALMRQAMEARTPPPAPSEPDARALARALQLGDEEEASKAIESLRGAGKGLTPEQAEEKARAVFREESARMESMKTMHDTFGELVQDPYLMQVAATEEIRLRNSGDDRPQHELWKSIAGRLRMFADYQKKAGEGMTDRETRKQSVSVPEPAGGRQPRAEDKPQTLDDVIEEKRKARLGRRVQWQANSGRPTP